MPNTTSIELKCECSIPFKDDLVSFLKLLFARNPKSNLERTPIHSKEIAEALSGKTLFLKVEFDEPQKKVRPGALKKIQKILHKDLVAVMKVGGFEVTYILL